MDIKKFFLLFFLVFNFNFYFNTKASCKEIFISNQSECIAVIDSDDYPNPEAKRYIKGDKTKLTTNDAYGIFLYNNELFVTYDGSKQLLVFDEKADGNTAPKRIITDMQHPSGVFVSGSEIFVGDAIGGKGQVKIFDINADGPAAPKRIISCDFPGTTTLGQVFSLTISGTELFVTDKSKIYVFNISDDGNVKPKRVIEHKTNPFSCPYGLAVNDGVIYVGDATRIMTFPISANGPTEPTTTISDKRSPYYTSLLVKGSYIYAVLLYDKKINVYKTTDSGDPKPQWSYANASKFPDPIMITMKRNTSPTASDISIDINEDNTKTFTSSDFKFKDKDEADSLHHIKITSLPDKGSLKLNEKVIIKDQTINTDQIASFKFYPLKNDSGSPYTFFKFRVSDGDTESIDYTFTINVTPKSKPVEPTPPSPSEPEEENGLGIDSGDGHYEGVFKKYKRSIKGTGSISGTIKASGSSKTVNFSASPLKGLTLNSDGSYTFDSSDYKELKKGERKTVKTSAKITDEKDHTFYFTIEIEVTGENDAPEIGKINNIIKYSNFEETIIPVSVSDPDNSINELKFSLEVKDPSIAEISLENNNQIRIASEPGISGTTGISLRVGDGEKTSVMSFKLKVLSLEDGDNVDEAGDVEVEVDGDVTKTKVKVPEDKIEIETKEDESTGNVEYDLDHNNKKSHAKSEIKGSRVEISNKGAEIVYEDENLKLNVSSSITGETIDKIEKNGNTTEFISKIPGGDTKIGKKDSRVEIETDLKVWETKKIKAVVGEDGSFKEEVTVNGKTTRLSTKIPGSKTVLDENESLKTNLEMNKGSDGNIRKINAVAITDPKGESLTWFEENGKVLERTISKKTPLETGTEIEIIQNGSEVEFKIRTELTRELIIE